MSSGGVSFTARDLAGMLVRKMYPMASNEFVEDRAEFLLADGRDLLMHSTAIVPGEIRNDLKDLSNLITQDGRQAMTYGSGPGAWNLSVEGWDDDIVMRSLEREQLEALLEENASAESSHFPGDLQLSLLEMVTPAQRVSLQASVSNLNEGYAEIIAQAKKWATEGKRKRSPEIMFDQSGVKPKRHKKNKKQRRKAKLEREMRIQRQALIDVEIKKPFLSDPKDGREPVDVSTESESNEPKSEPKVDTGPGVAGDDAQQKTEEQIVEETLGDKGEVDPEEYMTDESL